jgi:hypothetical protein
MLSLSSKKSAEAAKKLLLGKKDNVITEESPSDLNSARKKPLGRQP